MLTRREFVKLVMASTAGFSLTEALTPHLAEAFAGKQGLPIIYLETNTCGGDILSILNSLTPTLKELFFSDKGLLFSNTLSAAEGNMAIKQLFGAAEENKGKFILVVEGSISTAANGRYAVIGHRENGEPITSVEALKILAPQAKFVVCSGTCSSFGGPYAANPNPSGSKSVSQVIGEPVVNVSGCPVHPDWMMGTLTHLMLYGFPQLDIHRRPTLFYGKLIHDYCQRRQFYDNGKFAKKLGDPECMYKLGCKGPSTFSDCPSREWASLHYNWPVKANSPCIGCTSPEFPDGDSPFFERLPGFNVFGTTASANTVGLAVGAVTAAGIGAHLVGNIASGRLKHTIEKGRQDIETEKVLKEQLPMSKKDDAIKDVQDHKIKKWPDKVEMKIRSAAMHDGILPKRKKGIIEWTKNKLGLGKGEKNE